tara:strand:+ start:203 stop:1114 length:912 start_codon:yes stop_codon:yes gene_type:complete
MEKTLTRLALTGTLLGSLVVGGCSGVPEFLNRGSKPEEVASLFPKGHGHGYKFEKRTQDKDPYELERAVFFGEEFYVQARATDNKSEMAFAFYPFDAVTRQIDLDTGKVTLTSSEMYVPRRAIAPCADNPTSQCYVDKITFKQGSSEIGGRNVPGISADIPQFDMVGDDFIGSSNVEKPATYGVMTTNILGRRVFYPHVGESRANEKGKLPFYIVPKKGSEMWIKHPDGQITLRNPDSVFRPTLVELGGLVTISPGVAVERTKDIPVAVKSLTEIRPAEETESGTEGATGKPLRLQPEPGEDH